MGRKLVIAGNWKLNNTIEQSVDLMRALLKADCETHKIDIVVAPVFTALKAVYDELSQSSIQVSAQNVYWEEGGAYTGEVGPMMIKEAGCKWAIIGHSERRQYFGETDDTVNKRIVACLKAGLKVMMCIGESLEERESGKTFDVLDRQVTGGLAGFGEGEMSSIVIAYEPVWAIGTGKTATSDQAEEAHAHIRGKVAELYNQHVADSTRIIYGGSVKPANAAELMTMENVDGALVGGASLKASDFSGIINAAVRTQN